MPWIKIIRDHEAEGELKEVYRKIREQRRVKRSTKIATRKRAAGEPTDAAQSQS